MDAQPQQRNMRTGTPDRQAPLRSPHYSDAELSVQQSEAVAEANRARDELTAKLAENNERLAELLSESANCMLSLLPAAIPSLGADPTSPFPVEGASITAPPGTDVGLQNFEARGQEWFMTLNDVQLVLRSAVRHLRDAQVSPLTAAANLHDGGASMMGMGGSSSASRPTAEMGAAGRGHGLSLLHPFAEPAGGNDNIVLPDAGTSRTTSPLAGPVKVPNLEDIALSLSALRRQKQGWEDLRKSLEALSPTVGSVDGQEMGRRSSLPNVAYPADAESSSAAEERDNAKRSRRKSDHVRPRVHQISRLSSPQPAASVSSSPSGSPTLRPLPTAIIDDEATEKRARAKVDLDRQALARTVASADRRLLDALFASRITMDYTQPGGISAQGPVSLGAGMAPAPAESSGSSNGSRQIRSPKLTVSSRPQVSE